MDTMFCTPSSAAKVAVVGVDRVEDLFGVVDQVELVDGEDDVADPEEGHQVAVAPGLGQDPLAGVDQDHGQLRPSRRR